MFNFCSLVKSTVKEDNTKNLIESNYESNSEKTIENYIWMPLYMYFHLKSPDLLHF